MKSLCIPFWDTDTDKTKTMSSACVPLGEVTDAHRCGINHVTDVISPFHHLSSTGLYRNRRVGIEGCVAEQVICGPNTRQLTRCQGADVWLNSPCSPCLSGEIRELHYDLFHLAGDGMLHFLEIALHQIQAVDTRFELARQFGKEWRQPCVFELVELGDDVIDLFARPDEIAKV